MNALLKILAYMFDSKKNGFLYKFGSNKFGSNKKSLQNCQGSSAKIAQTLYSRISCLALSAPTNFEVSHICLAWGPRSPGFVVKTTTIVGNVERSLVRRAHPPTILNRLEWRVWQRQTKRSRTARQALPDVAWPAAHSAAIWGVFKLP